MIQEISFELQEPQWSGRPKNLVFWGSALKIVANWVSSTVRVSGDLGIL